MNLFRYKDVWFPVSSLGKTMRNHGINFDYRHKEAAEEFFGGKVLLEYDKDHKKGGLLWRITIPLWLVHNLLLVAIVCPLNWLFTGYFQIQNRTKLFKFSMAWHKKLFD